MSVPETEEDTSTAAKMNPPEQSADDTFTPKFFSRLHNCHLSGKSCEYMASVLQQPNCPLRELDMSGNSLFDPGVELLCSGLRSPNCKLEVLRLHNCRLSWESCEYMSSVLQQPNCPLRELDMSGNALSDGLELLCSGLKSPNCKLEVLRLYGCNFTAKSCVILDSVLGSEHSCLRELDLSNNYLDYSGEKLLAHRLHDPECKLKTLKTKPFLYAECPPASLGPLPAALTLPHSSALWSEPSVALKADVPNIQPEGSDCQTYHKADLARPEADTVLPGVSEVLKSDLSNIPPYSSLETPRQPQQPTSGQVPEEGREISDEPVNLTTKHDNDDDEEHLVDVSEEEETWINSGRSVVPEVFTPESYPYNGRKSYRFTCSSEGLFQCRYTGLVFKMETAGEVQYRTEPWSSTQLAESGYVPAGPLFDIKCPLGTLLQLWFPHCEVFSGKGRKHVSVIHISDSDESEMLDPDETTGSYVVLNISGCSKYGLTKKQPKTKYLPINGLVLLFLQELTLNVLLLPKNVNISEVCEKRRKMKEPAEEIYIETTPNCVLVPEKIYCLFSDPGEHEVTPLSATFLDYENYENYVPAFQVLLTKLESVKLNLKQKGSETPVWNNNVRFSACRAGNSPSASRVSSPYTPPGQDFFLKHKEVLEERLGTLGPVLMSLEKCKVLNLAEREEVESEKLRPNRNHILLDMLKRKGPRSQKKFYEVLKECDPYLVEDLEGSNEL